MSIRSKTRRATKPKVAEPVKSRQEEPEAPKELNLRQQRALPLVLAGESDSAVGDAVKVTRQTVWEWRHQDEAFIDELQRCSKELLDTAMGRLERLLPQVVDALEKALGGPQAPQTALALLKRWDLLHPPVDPEKEGNGMTIHELTAKCRPNVTDEELAIVKAAIIQGRREHGNRRGG